jgi:hypothetical protein
VPENLAELANVLEEGRGSGLLAAAAACLALGGLAIAWLAVQSCRSDDPAIARCAAVALFVFALIFQAGLRPLIDPIKDLRAGSLEIARSVPAAEPLLGFALDETTRAVVPFYSGRLLRDVDRPERALLELAAGPSRHVVVTESAEGKLTEELRRNLTKTAAVRLSATRTVTIYRFEPER